MGSCVICQNLVNGIIEVQIDDPNQNNGKEIKRKKTKFPKQIYINDEEEEEEKNGKKNM